MMGRYPSLINERGNLGTDKSVPYKNPCKVCKLTIVTLNQNCHGCKIQRFDFMDNMDGFRRGRIYPSRGMHEPN
ncbi:MAG: hypothetical protein FWG87_14120 [Defluviitaleaceae bacterium]|nr:hypothetical protein [Defluviitaleaceae bacterium]